MLAMVLNRPGGPLEAKHVPTPSPAPSQLLLRVRTCAVCRTDLHLLDGELPNPRLPVIPGHEIVGTVQAIGSAVRDFRPGERVGVPWLGWTCGKCAYCAAGRENLCPEAKFTGYTLDGGYAEHCVADARYCFRIPDRYADAEAAPLLCAGLIGFRSLRKTGDAKRIGIFGFGAAAHIIAQVIRQQQREFYAFTREGDHAAQQFALRLGAAWAGGSSAEPPAPLDAAIIFAPVGALVPIALRWLKPGGVVVCGGIHMSDIPSFSYDLLWQERSLVSVANLTRRDGEEFFAFASQHHIKTEVEPFALEDANTALARLRQGNLTGAAVLQIGS